MTGFAVGLFIGLLIAMAIYLRCRTLEEELEEIRLLAVDEPETSETEWLSREEFRKVKDGGHKITGGILRGEEGPTKFGLKWNELKELSRADEPDDRGTSTVTSSGAVSRMRVYDHDADAESPLKDPPDDVPPA